MEKPWVVGIDKSFYPEVSFWRTEEEADKEYDRLIKEESAENGEFESKVFKANLLRIETITTHA